jgi:hypothetical protein
MRLYCPAEEDSEPGWRKGGLPGRKERIGDNIIDQIHRAFYIGSISQRFLQD